MARYFGNSGLNSLKASNQVDPLTGLRREPMQTEIMQKQKALADAGEWEALALMNDYYTARSSNDPRFIQDASSRLQDFRNLRKAKSQRFAPNPYAGQQTQDQPYAGMERPISDAANGIVGRGGGVVSTKGGGTIYDTPLEQVTPEFSTIGRKLQSPYGSGSVKFVLKDQQTPNADPATLASMRGRRAALRITRPDAPTELDKLNLQPIVAQAPPPPSEDEAARARAVSILGGVNPYQGPNFLPSDMPRSQPTPSTPNAEALAQAQQLEYEARPVMSRIAERGNNAVLNFTRRRGEQLLNNATRGPRLAASGIGYLGSAASKPIRQFTNTLFLPDQAKLKEAERLRKLATR